MRVLLIHTRMHLVEFLRQPSYVITSLLFPTMFFGFFGLPNIDNGKGAILMMGSFSGFALIGISFFQLSVAIAQEKEQSFRIYLRTLDLSFLTVLTSRMIAHLLLSFLAIGSVIALASITCEFSMSIKAWALFFSALLFGAIPFSAIGFAVGFWVSAKNSVPLGNLIYLPLSFAGGLWMPPEILPKFVGKISPYLPTRHYAELIWKASLEETFLLSELMKLLLVTLLAACIAWLGYRYNHSKQ